MVPRYHGVVVSQSHLTIMSCGYLFTGKLAALPKRQGRGEGERSGGTLLLRLLDNPFWLTPCYGSGVVRAAAVARSAALDWQLR